MRCAAALQPDEFLTGTHVIMDAFSATASAQGMHSRAARLRGVADAMFAKNHQYRRANIDWEYTPYLAVSRSELGEVAFNAACADGRSMPQSEAVQYALNQGFERGSLQ